MKMIKFYNGFEMPQLGLGTFLMKEDEAIKTVLEAIKVGYRHFDTARMYENEKAIGKALKQSGLKREEFFITTKIHEHHSIEKTRILIEEALENLEVDYIDLLLIHWPNQDDEINIRTWKIFEEYYKKGVLKAIGVANFTRYQLLQLIENTEVKPMVNQIETHPALTQKAMAKFLKENDIVHMGYGPLMRGHLQEEPFIDCLTKIGDSHNVSPYSIAIAFGLNRGMMMIPKTVTKERLITNFETQSITLSKEELNEIFLLNQGKRYYTDPTNNEHGKLAK